MVNFLFVGIFDTMYQCTAMILPTTLYTAIVIFITYILLDNNYFTMSMLDLGKSSEKKLGH